MSFALLIFRPLLPLLLNLRLLTLQKFAVVDIFLLVVVVPLRVVPVTFGTTCDDVIDDGICSSTGSTGSDDEMFVFKFDKKVAIRFSAQLQYKVRKIVGIAFVVQYAEK